MLTNILFSDMKQLFDNAHGFCGQGFSMDTVGRLYLPLLHSVWGASAGKTRRLVVTKWFDSFEDIFSSMSGSWCWLLPGTSAWAIIWNSYSGLFMWLLGLLSQLWRLGFKSKHPESKSQYMIFLWSSFRSHIMPLPCFLQVHPGSLQRNIEPISQWEEVSKSHRKKSMCVGRHVLALFWKVEYAKLQQYI